VFLQPLKLFPEHGIAFFGYGISLHCRILLKMKKDTGRDATSIVEVPLCPKGL
jgi:hypothetical protein